MAVSLVLGPKDLTEFWKTKTLISCILKSFIQLGSQALIYSADTLFCISELVRKHLGLAFFLLSFQAANGNS